MERHHALNGTVPEVLEQHAEDAAFLWLLRDAAVGEPHYTLKTLARLDQRVEAHLDGLRVAGPAGWELARAGLATGEPGETFAAAVLAFESGDAARRADVLRAAASGPAPQRAVVSALGWIRWEEARRIAEPWLTSPSPAERLLGLAAFGVHRADPGPPLLSAARDPDVAVHARAVRSLGELGLPEHAPLLRRRLSAGNPPIRAWAAWAAGLRQGDPDALVRLKEIVAAGGPGRRRALDVLMRRLPIAEAHALIHRLRDAAETRRLAVQAAGMLGDPALVPWLLELMPDPALGRAAGGAFSLVTGCDLARENFDGAPPPGYAPTPNDDPKDPNVAMDRDENLPWPKPGPVAEWWRARASGLRPGVRHLAGRPVSRDHARSVLASGGQRARAAAALELAMTDPREPLFEVRAPAWRQQALLRPS